MHIHIPDGVFPSWLWISGILILLPIISLAIYIVRKDSKRLVITSATTALMLLVFSIEILGYHLNFTALSGMILGPWWSLLSITTVNVFLALFGHGGITVAPINILVNWSESLAAFLVFRFLLSKIKNIDLKSALSGVTVFLSLTLSFIFFLGIIALTGINPALQLEHDHDEDAGADHDEHAVNHDEEHSQHVEHVPLVEFAAISIIPLLLSGIIESILTSFMVIFISRVKPKLLR